MSTAWYRLSAPEVLDKLDSREEGLDAASAERRLLESGPNEIEFEKTPGWLRFLRQFNDPMVIILLVTASITGALTALGTHMLPDTIVILGVVLLNSVLGYVQEEKAGNALDALRLLMVQEALVLRAGDQQRIAARLLVPGDIVLLEGGDKIPADVRFIEVNNLHVDEASLTGESVPVAKTTGAIAGEDLVPADQANTGFSGTFVTRGSARAVVVETGRNTVFGRVADMVESAGATSTPLQRQLARFVRRLIVAILVVGAINFVVGALLGYSLPYSFLGAVSLVVAAIPEMLPALVTSILALSGVAMAKRKALVRNLPAAETLGATSVICSDKTGTLTENRMTVTRVHAGGRTYAVTGTGYDLEGRFVLGDAPRNPAAEPALMQLLRCGFYCNNAHITGESGVGDPTEIALRVAGAKAELTPDGVRRLEQIPFESSTKYMATLVDMHGERMILVKGAPEVVVSMCSAANDPDGNAVPLQAENQLAVASAFARDALRTLGFAARVLPPGSEDLQHEDLADMRFLGLQGMIDPPREAAIHAVALCKSAGIRTVMITGDHPDTALAVAGQLGIDTKRVLTGADLAGISEDELERIVEDVSVFGRVAPEHKKSIAEALQKNGHVVAMTGDGVNDAPALKAADIGIAMGINGTEVAKESADMVLADDNFETIVAAVEEGRHAWNNLQKAILYTLPTNAAQALLIIGAISMAAFVPLFGVRFVLEPVQILWINLLDSVLLTMPLMMEGKEKDLLHQQPRDPNARIMNRLFLERVLFIGLAISTPGFLVYYHFGTAALDGGTIDDLLLTQAQTAAFWGILFAHFGYVISARSIYASAFSFSPFSNRWLLAGIATSIAIRLLPTFVPPLAAIFRTAPIPADWWPIIALCFLPSFLAIETDKALRRSR
ncbi:MAG: HAD-IC family P-type ATPase [Woeseiaceae bacterium]|nr:HAD-IC family P-type ATPase [Woeseiaceae bacterium]